MAPGSAEEQQNGFPMRLKRLIDASAYSQRELADELGVSKQSVTNWTQGYNEPSLRHLRGIARLLDLPLGTLLEEAGDADRPDTALAASLLRELTSQPIAPAVRSLAGAAPDLFDLLNRAERYVRDREQRENGG